GVLCRGSGRRRAVGVVAVHVRTEGVGDDSHVERLLRQPAGEVAPEADVPLEATIRCGPDDGVDLAVSIDESTGMLGERMGEDIPLTKQWNDTFENRVGVLAVRPGFRKSPELTEVDIERKVDLVC